MLKLATPAVMDWDRLLLSKALIWSCNQAKLAAYLVAPAVESRRFLGLFAALNLYKKVKSCCAIVL